MDDFDNLFFPDFILNDTNLLSLPTSDQLSDPPPPPTTSPNTSSFSTSDGTTPPSSQRREIIVNDGQLPCTSASTARPSPPPPSPEVHKQHTLIKCGQCDIIFKSMEKLKSHRVNCYPDRLPVIPEHVTSTLIRHVPRRSRRGMTQYIRFEPTNHQEMQPIDFFQEAHEEIEDTVAALLDNSQRNECKVHPVMEVTAVQLNSEGEIIRRENVLFSIDALALSIELIDTMISKLLAKIEHYISRGSNWRIERANYFDMRVTKYYSASDYRGNGAQKIPERLLRKGAVVNVKQSTDQCFKYSILACMHAHEVKAEKRNNPKTYDKYMKLYNWNDITSPVAARDFITFERHNPGIYLNLLEWNEENVQHPVRVLRAAGKPSSSSSFQANEKQPGKVLNIIALKDSAHYMPVVNFNRLLSSRKRMRTSGYCHSNKYCERCLQPFSTEQRLKKHRLACYLDMPITLIPSEKTHISFDSWRNCQRLPYIVYADIECTLSQDSKDEKKICHIPAAFGMLLVAHPELKSPPLTLGYVEFVGENCIKEAMDTLEKWGEQVYQWNREYSHEKVKWKSEEEKNEYQVAIHCYMCKKSFSQLPTPKVVEHDHLTGNYRGAACQDCNTKMRLNRLMLPIFFHNFRNYDCHILCQAALGKKKGWQLSVIPQTKEKYMALFASFEVDKMQKYDKESGESEEISIKMHLAFKDSYQFVTASLDTLVRNLTPAQLVHSRRAIPTTAPNSLITAKGIFPYSYFTSLEKMTEPCLPPRESFFNDLTREECTSEDYNRAQEAWREFKCRTFGDYMLTYLKRDVHQLADVFEAFRNLSIREDGLDPAYFVSAPGMCWQSAFKMTEARVELLKDVDKYTFIEEGIRGGMTFVNKHYVQTETSAEADERIELLYIDANNLYGNALSQPLPSHDFKWLSQDDIARLNIEEEDLTASLGYILEVDLTYPPEIQDISQDLPFAPEKEAPSKTWLTPFMEEQWKNITENRTASAEGKSERKYCGNKKLLLTHNNKRKYVCHGRLLQFYLQQGMEITKIHRVLQFRQEAYFKKYIDYNSRRRQQATNNFEKDYYKLKNNSLFGKTLENPRKRMNFRLVNDENNLVDLASRAEFLSNIIFNDDLFGVHLCKKEAKMEKPIYIGMSVLELSKLVMYKFRYDKMTQYSQEFRGDMEVIAGDTDSFFIKVTDIDVENVLLPKMLEDGILDSSNFPHDHPCYSEKYKARLGCFKDECAGRKQQEWIFLRPKAYSLKSADGREYKRAKGVQRCVVNLNITHSSYQRAFLEQEELYSEQTRIASHHHHMYTYNFCKKSLSFFEDKRAWVSINKSLPYGNYLLNEIFPKYSPITHRQTFAPTLIEGYSK